MTIYEKAAAPAASTSILKEGQPQKKQAKQTQTPTPANDNNKSFTSSKKPAAKNEAEEENTFQFCDFVKKVPPKPRIRNKTGAAAQKVQLTIPMKKEIRLIKQSSHKAGAAAGAGAGVVLDNTNSSSSSTKPIADDAKEKLKPAKESTPFKSIYDVIDKKKKNDNNSNGKEARETCKNSPSKALVEQVKLPEEKKKTRRQSCC